MSDIFSDSVQRERIREVTLMMDFNFLATANGITSKYFSQEQVAKTASGLSPLDEEAKKKFGEAFSNAYDEMIATKALGENMRNSYENMHQDDF